MPDKDGGLCKSPQVGKNMFVGKTGWSRGRGGGCHEKQLEWKGGRHRPGPRRREWGAQALTPTRAVGARRVLSKGMTGSDSHLTRVTGFACGVGVAWRGPGWRKGDQVEGSRLEEGRPGGGPCRSLWCVNVFQKLLEREARPLETVHFRAKPWKDIKQLSVSLSLIPDGDTRVPCTLALRMSVHI